MSQFSLDDARVQEMDMACQQHLRTLRLGLNGLICYWDPPGRGWTENAGDDITVVDPYEYEDDEDGEDGEDGEDEEYVEYEVLDLESECSDDTIYEDPERVEPPSRETMVHRAEIQEAWNALLFQLLEAWKIKRRRLAMLKNYVPAQERGPGSSDGSQDSAQSDTDTEDGSSESEYEDADRRGLTLNQLNDALRQVERDLEIAKGEFCKELGLADDWAYSLQFETEGDRDVFLSRSFRAAFKARYPPPEKNNAPRERTADQRNVPSDCSSQPSENEPVRQIVPREWDHDASELDDEYEADIDEDFEYVQRNWNRNRARRARANSRNTNATMRSPPRTPTVTDFIHSLFYNQQLYTERYTPPPQSAYYSSSCPMQIWVEQLRLYAVHRMRVEQTALFALYRSDWVYTNNAQGPEFAAFIRAMENRDNAINEYHRARGRAVHAPARITAMNEEAWYGELNYLCYLCGVLAREIRQMPSLPEMAPIDQIHPSWEGPVDPVDPVELPPNIRSPGLAQEQELEPQHEQNLLWGPSDPAYFPPAADLSSVLSQVPSPQQLSSEDSEEELDFSRRSASPVPESIPADDTLNAAEPALPPHSLVEDPQGESSNYNWDPYGQDGYSDDDNTSTANFQLEPEDLVPRPNSVTVMLETGRGTPTFESDLPFQAQRRSRHSRNNFSIRGNFGAGHDAEDVVAALRRSWFSDHEREASQDYSPSNAPEDEGDSDVGLQRWLAEHRRLFPQGSDSGPSRGPQRDLTEPDLGQSLAASAVTDADDSDEHEFFTGSDTEYEYETDDDFDDFFGEALGLVSADDYDSEEEVMMGLAGDDDWSD